MKGAVLPFIRRVTKVALPDKIGIISEYDQGELEAGGSSGLFPLSDSIPISDKSHLKYFTAAKKATIGSSP
jgi:hypothetical protein